MGQVLQDALTVAAVVAIPFTAGASAPLAGLSWLPGALGAAGTIVGQVAGQNQTSALTSNATGALGAETAQANELANTPVSLAPFLSAEKGASETYTANAGQGVPNIGAIGKSMFGDALSNALSAVINQQTANKNEAGQLYSNAAGGYAGLAKTAGTNTAGLGGGLTSAISQITGAFNKPKSPGVATGPGTAGQPDIYIPSPTVGVDNPGQDIPPIADSSYVPPNLG